MLLAGWTLGGAIQPHVDIYLSQETFQAVKVAFPYMVQKEFASGGGDVSVDALISVPPTQPTGADRDDVWQVPEFRWHPWLTDRVPFEIGDTGISIKPLAGMYTTAASQVRGYPSKKHEIQRCTRIDARSMVIFY